MPARPIWRGHLRLALVSCPVALWNAKHERAAIRFNLLNPKTNHRIRMVTVDSETGEEVQRRDLVKGYEFRKEQYLLLSDEDFDSVKVESSSVISIEKFVPVNSIDPIYYASSYYLAPDGDAGRDVYAVLLRAIAETNRVAPTNSAAISCCGCWRAAGSRSRSASRARSPPRCWAPRSASSRAIAAG